MTAEPPRRRAADKDDRVVVAARTADILVRLDDLAYRQRMLLIQLKVTLLQGKVL